MTKTEYILWGFHPSYVGQDDKPYLIKLAIGSIRDCTREEKSRKDHGWTTGTYRKGTEPTGLSLMLAKAL
jgi:hypothetical protein